MLGRNKRGSRRGSIIDMNIFRRKKPNYEAIFKHPELEGNYGLDCDMELWAEFNKEIHIRNWVHASRDCALFRNNPHPEEGTIEFEVGDNNERRLAEIALLELIERGHLNPITYMKTID